MIGSLGVFLEVILSALISIFIFTNFKYSLYETFISLRKKEISQTQAIATNIGSFIGAVLLFIPGVMSDILGILLQIPIFYTLTSKLFLKKDSTHTNKDSKNENIIETRSIIDEHGNHIFISDDN
jgi:2-isopropylmalate synthase/UPF0716 protein FxsA